MKTNNSSIGSVVKLLIILLVTSLTILSCEDSSVISVNPAADSNMKLTTTNFAKGGNGNGSKVPNGFKLNSQRYNDSSMPAASGRDGEAVVTVRALINSAGVTDLEVTTGSLDTDAKAPGTLTKLLVKALDIDNPNLDNPEWEQNYNNLRDGGYFTTSYDNLTHGQRLYVHSNVRGIIRGMAVVNVTDGVKFRPDLAVLTINAPSEVFIGDPVHINAEITEGLGDMGATASCVMYVDGAEADRADGIWVDAGDAVVCAFLTEFNELGTREVKIAVENVVPGDYNIVNNSATTQIEVVDSSTNDFFGIAHAIIDIEPYFYSYNNRTQYGTRQYFVLLGNKEGRIGFPMDINVDISSGGNEWLNESITGVNANSGSSYNTGLPYNSYLSISESFWNGISYTNIHFNRYARDVVYYGYEFYNGNYYTEFNDTLLPYGTDITFDIQLNGSESNSRFKGDLQLNEISQDINNGHLVHKLRMLHGFKYLQPN